MGSTGVISLWRARLRSRRLDGASQGLDMGRLSFHRAQRPRGGGRIGCGAVAGARGLVKVYAEEKEWSHGQSLILEPMRGVFEKQSGGSKPELGDCGGEERGTSSGDSPL